MVLAVYDTERVLRDCLGKLVEPLRAEFYDEWPQLTQRARTAAGVIIVATEHWSCPPSLQPLEATEWRRRIVHLASEVGPIPLLLVIPQIPAHFVPVRRLPVDGILSVRAIADLPRIVQQSVSSRARHRLAERMEDGKHSGVPPLILAAFAAALRSDIPLRTCRTFAARAGTTERILRRALANVSASTTRHRLHWYIDAALLMQASEMARLNWSQARVAAELGISDRTLARARARVLGCHSQWQDVRVPGLVAQKIWRSLGPTSREAAHSGPILAVG